MLSIPLINRELLVAARSPNNYRLRLLVGAVGVGFLGWAMVASGNGINRGSYFFEEIHSAGMFLLAILAPLLTADIISKERREGTLDLLFLTTLTATKLVVAKYGGQLLRLVTVWAVLLPLSVVPFIAGGVSGRDLQNAVLIEFAIVLIGLAGGLLASALSTRALPAMLLGIAIGGALLWGDWQLLNIPNFTAPGTGQWAMEQVLIGNAVVAIIIALLVLRMCARIISRKRVQEGESIRSRKFRRVFLTPKFWKGAFNRSMRRRMDSNPLIWLEYRTAWSRVGRIAMVGAVILIESWMLLTLDTMQLPELDSLHRTTAVILLVVLGITSASSFQREKENGAFELLLVAPFTELSLLAGRLRAVWSYYFPVAAALVLLIIFTVTAGLSKEEYYSSTLGIQAEPTGLAQSLALACAAITIPIAGLYFTLRLKHFITTLIATLFVGLVLPVIFSQILPLLLILISEALPGGIDLYVGSFRDGSFPYVHTTIAVHVLLSVMLFVKTVDRLRNRAFLKS